MMRNIPPVTKYLLIVNVLFFLASWLAGTNAYGEFLLNDYLGLHFFKANDFHLYQFITYMFMHGGFAHIFFNMFALYMFGCMVEYVWGYKKFLFYYIICGIGAGFVQEIAQYVQFVSMGLDAYTQIQVNTMEGPLLMSLGEYLNGWNTVGASGAIYGILLAFGMLFPDNRIFIFPIPVPIKAKWLVIIYAGVELFSAMQTARTGMTDGVAHLAHLGGMLFGYLLIRYWRKHPFSDNSSFGLNSGPKIFGSNGDGKWWKPGKKASDTTSRQSSGNPDWDYNARKNASQEEIDRILDKIRKSGYDSLTKAEKQTLFDNSKKS